MIPKPMREHLLEWASRTTIHGITNIALSEIRLVRIIWTICLLCSIGFGTFLATRNLMDYLAYPVDTLYTMECDQDADFPALTFCQVQKCGIEYDTNKLVEQALFEMEPNNKTADLIEKMLHEQSIRIDVVSASVRRLFLNEYGPAMDEAAARRLFNETLLACTFNDRLCSANDFEPVLVHPFHTCWRFNSGQMKGRAGHTDGTRGTNVLKAPIRYGPTGGLRVQLLLGLPRDCTAPLSDTVGLLLYVHNHTHPVSSEYTALQLPPGIESNVAVDRRYTHKMAKPYTDCVPNVLDLDAPSQKARLVAQTFRVAQTYTAVSCMQLCYQEFMRERFGCYDPFVIYPGKTEDDRTPVCITLSQNCTLASAYANRSVYYKERGESHCRSQCPNECELVQFKTTVSHAAFPSRAMFEVLSNFSQPIAEFVQVYNETEELENSNDLYDAPAYTLDYQIRSTVAAANIYYRSDIYTLIKDKPRTSFEAFFSNFGGTLGLFLGISLLSVVEVVDIVFESICILISLRAKTKKRSQVDPEKAQLPTTASNAEAAAAAAAVIAAAEAKRY